MAKEKRSLCVIHVAMSLLNGWGVVQGVANGIRWLRKLKWLLKGLDGHFNILNSSAQKATPITAIEIAEEPRVDTDLEELNRVLGGGIVPGSLVLIGGDPGIGKSTLLLQVSALLANKGQRVFIFLVKNRFVKQNYEQSV